MEYLNEHDITSNMLKAMRSASRHQNKSVLTEGTNSDEEELTSAELSEEQAAFRDTVSPRVDFTGFKVYPNTKNVIFSGKFENMGGLEWRSSRTKTPSERRRPTSCLPTTKCSTTC